MSVCIIEIIIFATDTIWHVHQNIFLRSCVYLLVMAYLWNNCADFYWQVTNVIISNIGYFYFRKFCYFRKMQCPSIFHTRVTTGSSHWASYTTFSITSQRLSVARADRTFDSLFDKIDRYNSADSIWTHSADSEFSRSLLNVRKKKCCKKWIVI